MASIKYQKLVPSGPPGFYKSGSASIVSNVYCSDMKGKGHCKHKVLERLGKVIWLSEDRKEGIFLSEKRGLVEYHLKDDSFYEVRADDERIKDTPFNPGLITHTTFGDIYYCMSILNKSRLKSVLCEAFTDQQMLERVLCHVFHTIIKNGARISCSDFVRHSSLSYALECLSVGTLDRDSKFFQMMGDHDTKLNFFKQYLNYMREENPEFGKACYVDSTPLPNDVKDNPFNAFSSHGTGGPEKQTRLVLLLDIPTRKPIWFDFVKGNTLDHMTVDQVCDQVKIHLDIEIEGAILDAGYACKELFERFNINNYYSDGADIRDKKCMITRMPDKPGYPYGDCYQKYKDDFFKGEYHFVREEHTYFGVRSGPVMLFGYPEYVYTYVDIQQALALNQQYRALDPKEWERLSPQEKNWLTVKDGFFNLISNREDTPENMLDGYLDRVSIEHIFKTPKEYLNLLPCRFWTIERIKGKVLCDVISTILFLDIRRGANLLGITMPRFISSLSSLEASLDSENRMLVVSTPDCQLRNIFEPAGIMVPAHLGLDDFKKVIHSDFLLESPSIQSRPKKAGRPKGTKARVRVPESSEQKAAKKAQREAWEEEQKKEKAILKAVRKASKKVCDEATKVILLAAKGSVKCAENAFIRAGKALEEANSLCEEIKSTEEALEEIKKAKAELQKAELVLGSTKQGACQS